MEISININLFILGNLAPDAHDKTLEGNSCAHFRKIAGNGYDIYPNIDLSRFKDKYIENKIDEFAYGYYCHLLSDDNWVKLIYPKYLKFDLDAEKDKRQRELLFNDLGALNSILPTYYDCSFVNDIDIPEQFSIKEFLHERLELKLNDLYNDLNIEHNDFELKIFDIDFILHYIKTSINKCVIELKNLS